MRPPLALRQHRRLVVLRDGLLATFADVGAGLRPSTLPAQLLEAQPLAVIAMRTRQEIPALVGRLVLALDAAGAGDGRRRDDEDLAPGEGARARLGQRDCIALPFDVERIAIHFVEEQVAHRHRAQADRAVRAGHHQYAAAELLGEDGVARIARACRRDQRRQRGRLHDQRVDPLLGGALGRFHRRPHRHHRPGRVVDHVADPAAAGFGKAQLRAFHDDHALDRRGRREAVEDLAQVRRARGAPAPRFRRRLAGKHPVLVGPVGDRQQRIGGQALVPGALDLVRAFVVEHA